jgi:uncharacterized membrane protein YkvA (DUF1232 family)
MKALSSLRIWAKMLKRDVMALWLAGRDPRVPWYAKALAAAVAAYALSPIDLIPDFVPILGYVDDLVLVPLGIAVVVRLIPAETLQDLRQQASEVLDRPASRVATALILSVWIALALVLAILGWPLARSYISR